jgi:hypothetical protein
MLRSFTGLSLSQSAITQAVGTLCALGGNLHTTYLKLREEVKTSPLVNTDNTGWRIGGKLAFLVGFFTADPLHNKQDTMRVIADTRRPLPPSPR